MRLAHRSVRRAGCPECGRRRRDLWRHFKRDHPEQTFSPIGWDGRRLWWSVGWRPDYSPLDWMERG